MKRITITAAILLAGASAPAFAQRIGAPRPPAPAADAKADPNAAKGSIRPSDRARAALIDLQKTVEAKDFANVPAKIAAAQAVASTKEDRYLIGRLQLNVAIATNDNASAAAGIDAIAASGLQPAAEVVKLYMALGNSYFRAKQYPQAATQFQKAAALDPNNSDIMTALAEVRFAQGQSAEGLAAMQRVIALRTAAGVKPEEALYKRALSMAYQAKLPAATDLARAWLTAYPSAESWRNAIAIYRNTKGQDVQATLDLMRLMHAAGAMSEPVDYAIYAEAAAEQSNFNEEQAVLDAGIKAGVVKPTDPRFGQLLMEARTKRKSTAADLEAARKMAPAPLSLLKIGDRYLAMGNAAKAAEVYREVAAKPGADKDLAMLHLGMALAKSGDKAGAATALNSVGGKWADIAEFWLLWVQQRG